MNHEKSINISISTGTILKVLGILIILAFAFFIRDILLLIFISIIFAAVIEPLVNYLERQNIPRALGMLLIYAVLVFSIILIIRMIVPPIAEQLALLAKNFPTLWNQLTNALGLTTLGGNAPDPREVQQGLDLLHSNLQQAATNAFGYVISFFKNIFAVIMMLVITFYLVVQRDAVQRIFTSIAPLQYQAYLVSLFLAIQKKIGSWARGQLILGGIIGGLSFVGLLILLPKYALVLAIIAGITEMIPYIGPVIGAIPAVFLGFTVDGFSPGRGTLILFLYVLIQQLENNFIAPAVMKKQVGLNPLVIIIVMLIGARLAGIMGLILAIPVATAVQVVLRDFLSKSELPEMKEQIDNETKNSN